MVKRTMTIYISDESYNIIKGLGNNFKVSHFVDEQIKNNFRNVNDLKNKKDNLLVELEKLNKDIDLLEKYEIIKENNKKEFFIRLENNKRNYLIETIEVLKKNPLFIEGRINKYNNDFSECLTKIDFLNLLEDFKRFNNLS